MVPAHRFGAVLLACALTFAFASPTAATQSLTHTLSDGVVTQAHSLYYNVSICKNGSTGYAFVKWNTDFTRKAGGDREIDHANYWTVIDGGRCSDLAYIKRDTGARTYYPTFGTANSRSYGLDLNWPTIVPGVAGVGSTHKGYYTRKGGGSVVSSLCTNINMSGNFNGCWKL